ncbi:6-phosphogluconolactonase [Sulfitobacter undariae]|uniref:6-phosphogluconolactonase n=1 Tax=Sulfitobacter undariae TaxID=1563671 RepID=A0A7W6E494_9RHOB|nr:6-phosphogluconolactonase [Sulfitobacter undariae]MBB3994476.1 6-phosphogluconolactonase [Sulfitobacter undariae]
MNLIEYPDRDTLMRKTAQAIADDLTIALEQRDEVVLAVPGGTTPGPVFDILSATTLDWARVHVILTDERWVPESDAESNAALLRKRLLIGQAAAAKFTPYFTEGTDIASAAQNLSAQLEPILPVDVLLLGMGADMHTASLFPHAEGLQAALAEAAPMLLPVTVEGQKSMRFSLTAPVLRNAAKTHLLITGSDKRAALSRAASLPPEQAPVQIVLPNANVHWSAS